ncbi:uncharacterized protein TNIN_51101 [Trichonephila inaurata madagascariensis]|uniref:Synaptonemal complex protein 1 n=1 Tax=Trichonephila inaurata madagascariensis TaxID=2747483 RepID=A0A8X7C205_9ARAC|nr:uncharacterized protein TNIN_51101 [Trichonephila inaurata madagascariensis]
MHHSHCKTTYVRPLRENEANIIQQRAFASPVQQFKASDNNNVQGLGDDINLKSMNEVKDLYLNNLNSVHTKLFAGVEEIQRWKTSVEMESRQKNKKVEELLQTIELQRKTILDLQLQNENISYQLSDEMQQRSFVIEKLHSTKELCSALKKHYNTLEKHYEYRNKIEETINTADSKRLKAIETLQIEFEKVCRDHSEKIGYLNDALASETNKALNLKEAFEQQLTISENEKESLCSMIENYQLQIQKLSNEVDEEKNKTKLFIEEKNALKLNVQELEELNAKHVSSLEEVKENLRVLQNEKLENENKLLSENKRIKNLQEECEEHLTAAILHKKELEETVVLLKDTIANLESKISHMETKVEEEKHKNDVLTSSISDLEQDKCNLEAIISDARSKLTSFEQLKIETEEKLKHLEESNSELQQEVKTLKNDLDEKSNAVVTRDEKILNLESIMDAKEVQLEIFKYENTALKDSIEMEKTSVKICLECEQLTEKLTHMKDIEITLQKTEDKLCKQAEETMEIMKMLNDTEKSYNEDRIAKEMEIIKFQELIRRLEDEIGVMNVKLEEFNTLKSLNQKLKQEIEDLKLLTNKQEELDMLKLENKKLKDDLQDLELKIKPVETKLYEEESHEKNFAGSFIQKVQDKSIEKKNISKAVREKNKGKMKSCNQLRNKNSEETHVESTPVENINNEKKRKKYLQDKSPKRNDGEYLIEKANYKKRSTSQLQSKSPEENSPTEDIDFKKDVKQNVLTPEKSKWEIDSSGSEYLEIAYDKESENFMGLTPKKSPSQSVKLNSLGTRKSSFTSRLKRDSQTNSIDKNMMVRLPFKKNKNENSIWLQPMKTPESSSNFFSNTEKKTTFIRNTPSTPAGQRNFVTGTPTLAGQRKFFKTPLIERDNKFKKPSSQVQWSDFLKSTK